LAEPHRISRFPARMFHIRCHSPWSLLTAIASNRIDHLQHTLPTPWAFAERYGDEVLALVETIDE
jgi:hypothetical protein